MRVALCEDDKEQAERFATLAAEYGEAVELTVFYSAEEMLFECESFPFDVVFLDVQMKQMDGMTLAKEIRKRDKKLPIVFLTNYSEYVYEGYEVAALRYCIKPATKEKIYPIFDKIAEELRREKRYLVFVSEGENVKIDLDDVVYIEVMTHYLTVHTHGGEYTVKESLQKIASGLSADFVSTHRSYLVNLKYVNRVGKREVVMEGGAVVPVSRGAYKNVNEKFIAYYKEKS